MLYFVTEPETANNYFGTYHAALRSEFNKRSIPYREIALVGSPYTLARTLSTVRSRPHDTWLMSYAHNPKIEYIAQKPGRKFAHAHGLEASLFEPATLEGYALNEARAFAHYDAVFVNTDWARDLVMVRYPDLNSEVVVSGFPFDPRLLEDFLHVPKIEDLIVFNQRFALDKLHVLEVYLAERLISEGYQVIHLLPRKSFDHIQGERESRVLFRQGKLRGLKFVINDTKAEYYENLARAQILITTPVADTLSVGTLEAAALGVIPIAPNWGPFPEYLRPGNLYPPYNVAKIMERVAKPPGCRVDWQQFMPEKVVDIYLETMGVS